MADVAIRAAGGADAPLSYLVPGNAVIRIKQLHVTYVDNGAGSDWLPAVRIVDDSSHRMGTAADQGVKVTAGSDADVSFFPGVKHAAAAAAGADMPWGLARRDLLTVPSGAGFTVVDFDLTVPQVSFGSSGDGVVTLTVDGGGFHNVTLNTAGVYYVSWHVFAQNNGVPPAGATIDISSDFDTGDYTAGQLINGSQIVNGGPARNWEAGEMEILNLDPANYPIPNTGRIKMRQNAGFNLQCFIQVSAVRVSTITDPNVL